MLNYGLTHSLFISHAFSFTYGTPVEDLRGEKRRYLATLPPLCLLATSSYYGDGVGNSGSHDTGSMAMRRRKRRERMIMMMTAVIMMSLMVTVPA